MTNYVERHWMRVCAMICLAAFVVACGDSNGGSSSRTQLHVQALTNDLIFTLVHDGHDGLTDEHNEFMEELGAAHSNLSEAHQALIASFHDDELVPRGFTSAHFLHELYYNPLSSEIAEIVNDPKYLEVERAIHEELGVPFNEALATRASLVSDVPNVEGQAAALFSCTIATVIIIGIVAGVVAGGIVAGTVITLAVIDSTGAANFCVQCNTTAQNNCSTGTSYYNCDTKGAAAAQTSGEIEKEKDTNKTHAANNTQWVCSFQCN